MTTAHLRRPTITVSWLNGLTDTAFTRVLEARCDWGVDVAISSASFVVPEEVDLHGATYFSYVTITLDGGGSPPTWKGFITGFDFDYYPRGITVRCSGALILAQLQEGPTYTAGAGTAGTGTGHDTIGGTLLVPDDLSGTDDGAMVLFLLNTASAGTFAGSIGTTGRTLGTFTTAPFRWAERESALSAIQRVDQMSAQLSGGNWLLYRTYDTYGGSIDRLLIDTVPGGSPALTFTEEVDIFAGRGGTDILQSKNRVTVSGYDAGRGAGAVNYTVEIANAYLTAASFITLSVDNPMIEVQTEADVVGTIGISCEGVANALIRQWRRTQERATFTTPLDVAPALGATIAIATPSTNPERLGSVGNYWLQHVARSIGADGTFGVELTIVRGAS